MSKFIDFRQHFAKEIKAMSDSPIKPINNLLFSKHIVVDHSSIRSREHSFAMASISTYPIIEGVQQGEPNCDKVGIVRFTNATLIALGDGCGWGTKSSIAARQAVYTSLDTIIEKSQSLTTVKSVAELLVDIAELAQQSIFKTRISSQEGVGTTTLTLSFTFSTLKDKIKTVALCIGDSKLYHYNSKNKTVKSCFGERHKTVDKTSVCLSCLGDAGGGLPALRGSGLLCFDVQENDCLIAATDGMYDNFEPSIIMQKMHAKDALNKILGQRIQQCANLCLCVESLCNYVIEVTEKTRQFHQNNPRQRRPDGLPGKLDHTTIALVCVEKVNKDVGLVDRYEPPQFKTLVPQTQISRVLHSKSFGEKDRVTVVPVKQVGRLTPVECEGTLSPPKPHERGSSGDSTKESLFTLIKHKVGTFTPPKRTPCITSTSVTPRMYRENISDAN
ncbi:hypothetical protein EIN_223240 [Entamoeba invadens IP1]|uniref:PPM-type phosphatase domain-containing protein n=1 Tax=Entamoeba invadens IP1 TaxID=370355 RepID=A0A0A1U237_ENTIV|nr:hypothetical protein EIN_223240 [Entamoeba invadens IP1]ELP88131.1 hypothetical protein EIN_223240 [Entamoeba invadens IP1]|eukprot:XP_004254902.1 hypothetical protein EIN_223240 [Entamoeba invadens IP1]